MDDATIEDEIEFEEELSSQPSSETTFLKWSNILQLLSEQWVIFLLLAIAVITFLYISAQRRRERGNRNSSSGTSGRGTSHDSVNRYDDMERVRERQQKAYEEQALIQAEKQKAKIESLKASNKEKPERLKYRSDDHNPLTGQSTRGSGDSCSWRPSSSRRKPAGG